MAAEEGTAAHAWCEYKLNKLLNRPCEKPSTEYDLNEMQECSDAYVDFVLEKYEQAKLNCLVKNGYPPQYSPEVFTKVMGQVENFEGILKQLQKVRLFLLLILFLHKGL